jgi:hypothetical protein
LGNGTVLMAVLYLPGEKLYKPLIFSAYFVLLRNIQAENRGSGGRAIKQLPHLGMPTSQT